jgi:hypothetical protein
MQIKERSSYEIQREFPVLNKRYWGQRFWAHGSFSTTSGNATNAAILQYIELHSKGSLPASAGRRSVLRVARICRATSMIQKQKTFHSINIRPFLSRRFLIVSISLKINTEEKSR